MIWWNLIFAVVSFIALYFLSPKPKQEKQRAAELNDIDFPRASDGAPISLILGKVRQKGPNTLWYGDFLSVAVYEKVKTGILGSNKQHIGYDYYVGFDLGLGVGPDCVLRRIWIDKDVVWEGTAGPAETAIVINKPDLFGGKKRGGGWVGTLRFYGGSMSQGQNAYLVNLLTHVPAYRGQCHAVFERPKIGMSAQLRPLSFEIECFPNTLGLPGSTNRIGDDLNPAEAIYYMMTNGWAGAGLDPSKIDVASFTAAAATLYAEGNGISLLVSSPNQAETTVQEVLRQIDGAMYEDPLTGKLVLKLIRADYNVNDLPVFDETNIMALREFTRSMWSETANEMRVTFTDRGSAYNTVTAMAQDMANINSQGRVRSQTLSFPGCCTASLAASLAARELGQVGVPMFKASFEMNREAFILRPGSPFVLSWEDYGIVSAVMRVQKISMGTLEDGRLVVEAAQDAFGASTVVFASPPPTLTDPISRDPSVIGSGLRTLQEIPYFVMQEQTVIAAPLASDSAWTLGLCRQPSGSQQGYSVYIDTASGFTAPSTEVDRIQYSDTALVHTAIGVTDGRSNGQVNVRVKLLNPSDFTLATKTSDEQRAGDSLFLIGNELFAYTTVTDHGDGSFTLASRRALLDTQFEAHAIDDTVWFLTSGNGIGASTFGDTATVYAKFASFTDRGEYDVSAETPITLTFNQRYDRPLPPDLPTFGGVNLPGTITTTGPHTVAWRERNRTDALIPFEDDATDTPESGQTYRIEFWDDGAELTSLRQTGVSGTSTTVTLPEPLSGAGEVRIYAERSGLLSRVPAPLMNPTWAVPPPP